MTQSTPGFSFELQAMLAAAPPVAGRSDGGATSVPATTGAPGSSAPSQGAPAAPSSSPFGPQTLLLMVGLLGLMIVMQIFGGRKEKKRRAEMLATIKRHDKVQTIGGMIGTVSEVRDDEIVLKVDESTNTKIRFARSAVQQVIKQSSSHSGESEEADAEKIGA